MGYLPSGRKYPNMGYLPSGRKLPHIRVSSLAISGVASLSLPYGTKTLLQWSLFLGATERHLIGLASMISQIVISYLIHHIYREYFTSHSLPDLVCHCADLMGAGLVSRVS